MNATGGNSIKVSARQLGFFYGDFPALENVSINFNEYEVSALIGPSGCGKSTFLRCLNRMNDLVPGTRVVGELMLDGQNVYAPVVDVVNLRSRIGMVFQKPNPFPMSVFENIAYGLRVKGIRDKVFIEAQVVKTLQLAALWQEVKDRLNASALALSGGQQQRLCIARALAIEPEVLLMDEPCSALDPIATQSIEELIAQLKPSFTIIIVTHNMQQAARVSDRAAFFYMGRLIETGPTARIFTQPQLKKTADYVTGRFG